MLSRRTFPVADALVDKRSFAARALTWQSHTDLIESGGISEALWNNNTAVAGAGASSARTFAMVGSAFRQDGYIRQVTISVNARTGAAWSFRLFRWNSGTSLFDYVAGSDTPFTPGATGKYTLTFTTPMAVQQGDIPTIMIPNSNNKIWTCAPRINRRPQYTTGDITVSDAFATSAVDAELAVCCYSTPPYLVVTGDSLPEGHNGAVNWHGPDHNQTGSVTNPGGTRTAEISYALRVMVPSLLYQNHSLGSQTFNWVATTGIVKSLAVKPGIVLVHAGVNDVSTARAWADVQTDLNTILAAVNAASPKPRLVIDEVLPWTNGGDPDAAAVRALNANLANWCLANGARLIQCHDPMGQIRVSTGYLDDLKTAYNQGDNLHLSNPVGVQALAAIWARYL